MEIILISFCLIFAVHGKDQCLPNFWNGHGLIVPGYKNVALSGVYDCAKACGFETDCLSFTLIKDSVMCILSSYDNATSPDRYIQDSETFYGEKQSIFSDAQLMGSCQNHTCQDYYRCVHLTTGGFQCVRSACGQPPVIPRTNARNCPVTPVGETLIFSCSAGYTGSATLLCLTDGSWSDPNNLCVDCGQPPQITHASIQGGGTTIGSTRTYSCGYGYTASGSVTITCRNDASWEHSSMVCEPDCTNAPQMESNATTSSSTAPFGSSITYSCDGGYTQSGTGSRPCLAGGVWGSINITCTEDVSLVMVPIDMITNPLLMGNCLNKVCPQYHRCVSLASGSHKCIISACGQPPGIPRTNYQSMILVPIGETLVYTCLTGYVGNATTTCLPNGEWSEPNNLCVACDQPPSIPNTNEYTGNTLIGTTLTYVCDSGYTPSGSVTIECRADATWESTSLVCEPDCENAPSNIDSSPYTSRTYFGASVAYACSTGCTNSSGTGYRPCEANGMWGNLDLVCDPLDCGWPPAVSGTQSTTYSSTTYLGTATYTCSPTRTSTNPSQMSVHCQSDGSWSAVQFQCQNNGPGQ